MNKNFKLLRELTTKLLQAQAQGDQLRAKYYRTMTLELIKKL